ncbi:MAG: alanyl-tRNA editing protein [Promethearchaeota archaeon]
MTEKLYWEAPYETTFTAKVIGVTPDGVTLDKTLFYPQGGGQENDRGILKKEGLIFKVEIVTKEGDDIIHHISSDLISKIQVGDLVLGEIDWNFRYGVMRAHSAQHILSALIKNKYNIDTAHATISFDDVSLQTAHSISGNQFKEILDDFITMCTIEKHEFQTKVVYRDEIDTDKKQIRGKIPEQGKVRLVELKNIDLICCGGTHVKNTAEIGPIFVYEFNKGTNFKFLVGSKALNQFTTDNYRILDYARNLNLPALNMVENFQKQLDKKLVVQRNYEILAKTVLQLVSQNPTKMLNDVKIGCLRMDYDYKNIQKAFKDFPKDYLLIILEEKNKIRILSNTEKARANDVLQKLLKKFGGKGGGSPFSAQATLREEPKDLLIELEF